jgi:hypothetical protein
MLILSLIFQKARLNIAYWEITEVLKRPLPIVYSNVECQVPLGKIDD